MLELDFTVVSKVLHTSHLLLSNITLDVYPAMTAATYTPSSLSMQDSNPMIMHLIHYELELVNCRLCSLFLNLHRIYRQVLSTNLLSTKHLPIIPSLLTQLKIYPHSPVNILRT